MHLPACIAFVMAAGSSISTQRRAACGRAWHETEAADRCANLFVVLFAVVSCQTTPGETLRSSPRHLRCPVQVVFAKGRSPQIQHSSKLVEGQDLACHDAIPEGCCESFFIRRTWTWTS